MSLYGNFVKHAGPLVRLYHRLEIFGIEHVPPPGEGFVLAANHSGWFGWDALVLGSVLPDYDIRWAAWSYAEKHPDWDRMVAAFNGVLFDRNKPFPFEEMSALVSGGGVVGIFPEGNSNPMGKWYRLRPFLPGCARLAAMAGAPVIPAAVSGLEEASPILWAKEEEKEPIKTAVALPVVFPTKVKIEFGPPMQLGLTRDDAGNREALKRASKEIQLAVLDLLKKHRPKAWAE